VKNKQLFPAILFFAIVFASCGSNGTKQTSDSIKAQDSVKHDSVRTAAITPDSSKLPYKLPDAAQLEKDIKAEKVKVLFEGMGTEPFWTVYITEKELLYINEGTGEKEVYPLENSFNSKLKKQDIRYKNGNASSSVTITRGEASLGMGPDMYPYGIHIGPTLDGGGDTLYIKSTKKYEREVN
jgi:uncharacterized membrane protein